MDTRIGNADSTEMSVEAKLDVARLWNRLAQLAFEFNESQLCLHSIKHALTLDDLNLETLVLYSKYCDRFEDGLDDFEHTYLAIELFNKALKTTRKKPNLLLELAKLFSKLGDYEKTLEILEELEAPDFEAHILRASSFLALNQDSNFELALSVFNNASLSKSHMFDINLLITKYYFQHEDFDKALEYVEASMEGERFNKTLYFYLILIAMNKDDFEQALEYSQSSLTYFGLQDYDLLMLNCFLSSNQFPRYSTELLTKLVTFPKASYDFLPWFLLSANYFMAQDFDLSFACLQRSFKITSKVSMLWILAGKIYLNLNQLPDALSAFSQSLRLQTDDDHIEAAHAWNGLSNVYEVGRHVPDAIDACDKTIHCLEKLNYASYLKDTQEHKLHLEECLKNGTPATVGTAFYFLDKLIVRYLNIGLQERAKLCEITRTNPDPPLATRKHASLPLRSLVVLDNRQFSPLIKTVNMMPSPPQQQQSHPQPHQQPHQQSHQQSHQQPHQHPHTIYMRQHRPSIGGPPFSNRPSISSMVKNEDVHYNHRLAQHNPSVRASFMQSGQRLPSHFAPHNSAGPSPQFAQAYPESEYTVRQPYYQPMGIQQPHPVPFAPPGMQHIQHIQQPQHFHMAPQIPPGQNSPPVYGQFPPNYTYWRV